MATFYETYVNWCAKINKSPSRVALEIGLSKTAVHGWKEKGTSPTDANLQRIADYFGITVAELLGEEKKTATNVGDDLQVLLGASEEDMKAILAFLAADEKQKSAIKAVMETWKY